MVVTHQDGGDALVAGSDQHGAQRKCRKSEAEFVRRDFTDVDRIEIGVYVDVLSSFDASSFINGAELFVDGGMAQI